MRAVLERTGVALLADAAAPHAFYGRLRLLPGAALNDALPALRHSVAAAIFAHPPYELSWLPDHPSKAALLAFVTDKHVSLPDSLAPLPAAQLSGVLALRGFLAFGLLEQCLLLRHRVKYGVGVPHDAPQPRAGGRGRRQAVPFRFADVPADRAEFARVDVALLLTALAYAYDGLGRAQLCDAIRLLSKVGSGPARDERWQRWRSAALHGTEGDAWARRIPASAAHLDADDTGQVNAIYERLRLHPGVALFWLERVVFALDVRHHPRVLTATPWHLTAGHGPRRRKPIGFSGTNDCHRLLPCHVHSSWDSVADPHSLRTLQATDGRMLALVLQQGEYCELLPSSAGVELWREVVTVAVQRGASALIDAGALLAGVAPRRVAEQIWSELELHRAQSADAGAPPRLAVIYNEGGGVWWAPNADGAVPLRKAPVSERDAFIVFCEQDCRGVDKDLRDGALAVLTLGPRMWKSTLVQVRAGRGGGGSMHLLSRAARGRACLCLDPPPLSCGCRRRGVPAGSLRGSASCLSAPTTSTRSSAAPVIPPTTLRLRGSRAHRCSAPSCAGRCATPSMPSSRASPSGCAMASTRPTRWAAPPGRCCSASPRRSGTCTRRHRRP